jgi:hypothetical protein
VNSYLDGAGCLNILTGFTPPNDGTGEDVLVSTGDGFTPDFRCTPLKENLDKLSVLPRTQMLRF